VSDSVGDMLDRLTPRGPDADLRRRVLEVVAEELVQPQIAACRPIAVRRKTREGRLLAATAAAIALALALNFAVAARNDALQLRLLGPAPTPRSITEVVQAVESVTDRETAEGVRRQLIAAQPSEQRGTETIIRHYERLLHELADTQGRTRHEDREMDRHRAGLLDRDTSRLERHLGVAERRRA
jgi:hypothetical protein